MIRSSAAISNNSIIAHYITYILRRNKRAETVSIAPRLAVIVSPDFFNRASNDAAIVADPNRIALRVAVSSAVLKQSVQRCGCCVALPLQ